MGSVEASDSSGPQNRRSSPRIPVDFPIGVSARDALTVTVHGAGEMLRGRAIDLCREAVLVEAERNFPRGTDLEVRLEFSGRPQPIDVRGRVVRMGPTRTGVMAISFVEPSGEVRAAIDALVT